MKRTRRDTTKASSSRRDRQCLTTSTRRHKAARLAPQEDQPQHEPLNHFEDTTEVEDVAATHDSNVEVDVKPTEPSRVSPIDPSLLTSFKTHIAAAIWNNQEREPLRCMSKASTLHEWNWWANPNNSIFKWYI
ncbi:unnamed protein product [Prunus armeniaca]